MTDKQTIHTISAAFSFALITLNWSSHVEYLRPDGHAVSDTSPIQFSLSISALTAACLAYRCVKAAHDHLVRRKEVKNCKWIPTWFPLSYPLPLLLHHHHVGSQISASGLRSQTDLTFGHQLSVPIFLLAMLSIILFQILNRFQTPDPDKGEIRGV